MTQEAESRGGFLSNLAPLFRGKTTGQTQATDISKFEQMASTLNQAVHDLSREMERKRQETFRTKSSAATQDVPVHGIDRKAQEEQREKDLESAHRNMRACVLQYHAELNSGIGANELSELEKSLNAYLEAAHGSGLEDRIRSAILDKLYAELGEITWEALQNLMVKKGLAWEDSPGRTSKRIDPETGKPVCVRAIEVQEIFCSQGKEQAVSALFGMVSAWKVYPPEDSWLWRDLALRSVGAGMRAMLMREAVEGLKAEAATLRARAEELIQGKLHSIQQMLDMGVQSVDQAQLAISSTDKIIREVLPAVAWDMVEELVQRRANELWQR